MTADMPDATPFAFTYRNWRGEFGERRVIPIRVWFGSTEWHPEPQWFLNANDLDKGETRDFAMRDIGARAMQAAMAAQGGGAWEAGELTTLAECPVGLFLSDGGELCFKSEYGDNNGRIDAYIVRSGEFFWGAPPQTIASQRRQVVRPVARPAPEVKDAAAPLTMPVAHDPRYPSSGCSTKTVQGTLYNATKPTTPAPAASDELVERLRAVTEADAYAAPWTFGEKCREAAAEMERKDARIAHLEVEKDFISAEYLRSAKALHCNWRSHDPDASAAKDLEKVLWDADHKAAAALRPAKGGRDGE